MVAWNEFRFTSFVCDLVILPAYICTIAFSLCFLLCLTIITFFLHRHPAAGGGGDETRVWSVQGQSARQTKTVRRRKSSRPFQIRFIVTRLSLRTRCDNNIAPVVISPETTRMRLGMIFARKKNKNYNRPDFLRDENLSIARTIYIIIL